MLTQCPNCRTLFRVKPDQLEIADGKVRCSQCNQVFNALIRLLKTDDETPSNPQIVSSELFADEEETTSPTWEDPRYDDEVGHERKPFFATDSADANDLDDEAEGEIAPTLKAKPSTKADEEEDSEFIFEQDDGLEPAPDYLDVGTESQMSELLDQDTEASILVDEDPPQQPGEIIDFYLKDAPSDEQSEEMALGGFDADESILKDEIIDTEEGKPDYDSVLAFQESVDTLEANTEPLTDDKTLTFEADKQRNAKPRSSIYWLLGSILLMLMLGAQLTWQFRHELIQYDTGRQVVGLFCNIVGCEVPIRRDTSKIIIQGRNLSSDPSNPDILIMQLSMVNTASYEQPYPKLQLSLFDDNGKLVARRVFTANEYLANNENISMMPKAVSILAKMQVIDPGEEVTGFSFDFL